MQLKWPFLPINVSRRAVPLRWVLIVPFVVQIFIAVGLTGWFSLRNGQKAVKDLATQLRNKTSYQVTHHLEDRLVVLNNINQLNVRAIRAGGLSLKNFDQMGRIFHQQMQIFDVGYVNFANPQGEFIGVERLESGALLINERSRRFADRKLYVYASNSRGDRQRLIESKPYNPLIESWYADAVKAQRSLWSAIYQWDDKPEIMSISFSTPLYDQKKQLLGVMGVDLILTEFSSFLQTLNTGASGKIFIMERNGLLVASSSSEPPFHLKSGKAQRIRAAQSQDPLIRNTAAYLVRYYSSLIHIQSTRHLSFQGLGQEQFIQVTPWKDAHGLDWLIVVVVPESAFMEQIYTNTYTTVLLCLLALASSILLGLMTSRWISQRIQQLVEISQDIADGNLEQTADVEGIQEFTALSHSFNQMAAELRIAFTDLENRVTQRTAELSEAKNAAEAANSAKSQFLESMSHELRTPLNAILGVAQVFQRDPSLTPQHQEHIKILHRNAHHLLSLINDLLEIAKIGIDQKSEANRFDQELLLKLKTSPDIGDETVDQTLELYLTRMSSDWVERLHEAAIKGSDQEILALITQIPGDCSPLAESLKSWVEDFQFDTVIGLVQRVEKHG